MKKKGFSLVELMIAVALISIGILVMVESFGFIQRAILTSKNKTIATNLAQEKMQILKQRTYFTIVPTTAPAYLTDFSPNIPYDNYFFSPESILEAGVRYTRYTYVQVVKEDSGKIVVLPPTTPDTGLRMITITTVWEEKGEKKKIQLNSLISNPDTVMSSCLIEGTITNAVTFAPIENAIVNIAENLGYRDTTNSSGKYSIGVTAGNYTLYVNAWGYFPAFKTISIGANETQTNNFGLIKMATGTIYGYPWIRDHLVISQIVGSTISISGWDQEYIEIFNPTTWTWTVNGEIGLKYQRIYDNSEKTIRISYFTDSIPSGGFYLFANTGTITAGGVTRNADAVWDDNNSIIDFPDFANQKNIIRVFNEGGDEGGGAIELYKISDGKILDQVGWNRNDGASGKKIAPFYEGLPIQQNIGLERNELYIRYSSTNGVLTSYGPSYDSNNNSRDFHDYSSSISIGPRNSSITLPVIAATPAEGTVISCSDGLSSATTAYLTGNPPYAKFELVDVATGTWSVIIASSNYYLQNDTVTIANNGDIYIFASSATFLDNEISWGYITGRVVNANNQPISPAITVINFENTASASISNGRYFLMSSTGSKTVVANPNNQNPNYVSVSSENVTVSLGQITSGVDFVLYQGARIRGFITRDGINALPGVTVIILDSQDVSRDQQVSDNNGRWISNVLSTGTYTVQPVVDSKETVTPSTKSVTLLSPGVTYFSSTFTVSNAMGYVKGSVSKSGEPIKTGVLIVVTTTTLTGGPPDLSVSTLTGPPYYITSSNEDGNYTVEVRHSTNPKYNVYAYYPVPSGYTATIYISSRTNVSVVAGQETTGINFAW